MRNSVLVVLAVLLLGCSSSQERVEPFVGVRQAEQSEIGMRYWSAMAILTKSSPDDSDLDEAAEIFTRLRRHAQYTRYGRLALLRLADIARMRQQWEKAISLYTDFLRLELTYGQDTRSASYASFYIGYCYMKMAPGRCCCMNLPLLGETCVFPPPEERKLDNARKAYEAFSNTAAWYKGMKYGEKARVYARKMEDLLAGHELYVARFYWKRQAWLGTILRTQTLLMNYPGSRHVPEARLLLARACFRLARELRHRARRPGEWTAEEYVSEGIRQLRILAAMPSVPASLRREASALLARHSRRKD